MLNSDTNSRASALGPISKAQRLRPSKFTCLYLDVSLKKKKKNKQKKLQQSSPRTLPNHNNTLIKRLRPHVPNQSAVSFCDNVGFPTLECCDFKYRFPCKVARPISHLAVDIWHLFGLPGVDKHLSRYLLHGHDGRKESTQCNFPTPESCNGTFSATGSNLVQKQPLANHRAKL